MQLRYQNPTGDCIELQVALSEEELLALLNEQVPYTAFGRTASGTPIKVTMGLQAELVDA